MSTVSEADFQVLLSSYITAYERIGFLELAGITLVVYDYILTFGQEV